jgi:hypothetical protein
LETEVAKQRSGPDTAAAGESSPTIILRQDSTIVADADNAVLCAAQEDGNDDDNLGTAYLAGQVRRTSHSQGMQRFLVFSCAAPLD